jgi:hypothetical protein
MSTDDGNWSLSVYEWSVWMHLTVYLNNDSYKLDLYYDIYGLQRLRL